MRTLFSFVFVSCLTLMASHAKAQGVLPVQAPIPKDNPQSKAKIDLGKQLYFDPRLSSTGNLSCNSCHNVMGAGDDNRAASVGVKGQLGGRSSPTVYNSAFISAMFWDGRAPSLEEQAKGPLINPVEMGMKDHGAVEAVVKQIPGYVESFKKVFGGDNPVNIDNIAKAIASYERTLITPDSDYDRCTKGIKPACNPEAQKGFQIVQDVGCLSCHSGANFSGPPLPPGTPFFQRFPTFTDNTYVKKYKLMDDKGRFTVTNQESDSFMWRVPTWRNVALTAPYFHNGAVKTLPEAVRVMAKTQLNKDLSDGEVKAIVAFLNSLNGKIPKQEMPILPQYADASLITE